MSAADQIPVSGDATEEEGFRGRLQPDRDLVVRERLEPLALIVQAMNLLPKHVLRQRGKWVDVLSKTCRFSVQTMSLAVMGVPS